MAARRSQEERSRTTRAALLASARAQFAERGFAATNRDDIAAGAGVTRGALYHHFATKEDVFRAVVEELEEELVARVIVAAEGVTDPGEQLRTGCIAFLDACADPAVRRIVLLDAPAVLGWDTWRAIDAQYGLALVRTGLESAMAAGRLSPAPVDALAHTLLGALNEAAIVVANARDPAGARAEMAEVLDLVLSRLLDPPAEEQRDRHPSR
jgi:AcrR family transcriptional regulator